MSKKNETMKLKMEDIENVLASVGVNDEVANPARYLATLMIGVDPREGTSRLYKFIKKISDRDDEPSFDEWLNIKEMVLHSGLYSRQFVSLETSADAAKTLIKYVYAKKRAVTIEDKTERTGGRATKLTPEEVDIFEENFLARL